MTDLPRLKTIAQYQHETGCRVEYPASTILELVAMIETKQRRIDFLLRNFTNPNCWDEETIDQAIAARKTKGFE